MRKSAILMARSRKKSGNAGHEINVCEGHKAVAKAPARFRTLSATAAGNWPSVASELRGIALLDHGRRREALAVWLAEDLPARFAGRIVPIDPVIAERWGDLMAQARQSGFALSAMDGFLAATALDRELVLATRNTKDFAPLGVPLLNPWIDGSATR